MIVDTYMNLLNDWAVLAWLVIATFVIPVTNAVSQRCIFRPLGKIVLGIKDWKKTDEDQEKQLTKLTKFEESAWKWLAYGSISAVSAYALHDKPFWHDTRELWTECTALPCEYQAPVEMRIAYAFDMAYYTYAIPYAVIYETKRKDMYATMIHHVITVALIGYSYVTGFTKVGVVIMFIHDVCDVLLELAKMARYADWELGTNVIFGVFTLVWIFMRNYVFPFHVVRSVLWEAHDMLVVKAGLPGWPHYHIFSVLLIMLGLLQVYWTVLILKILHRALFRGASVSDSREADDSD